MRGISFFLLLSPASNEEWYQDIGSDKIKRKTPTRLRGGKFAESRIRKA